MKYFLISLALFMAVVVAITANRSGAQPPVPPLPGGSMTGFYEAPTTNWIGYFTGRLQRIHAILKPDGTIESTNLIENQTHVWEIGIRGNVTNGIAVLRMLPL